MGADLTKKLGPLPVWAWGLIVGGVAFIVYRREAASSATAATATDTTAPDNSDLADPSQSTEDPATGAGDGSGQSTVTPPDEFGDFLTFMGEWSQIAQSMGWVPPGTTPTSTTDPSDPNQSTVPPEAINITLPTPSVPKTPKTPKPKGNGSNPAKPGQKPTPAQAAAKAGFTGPKLAGRYLNPGGKTAKTPAQLAKVKPAPKVAPPAAKPKAKPKAGKK